MFDAWEFGTIVSKPHILQHPSASGCLQHALVQLLLEAGANLNARAEGGSTPLLLATGNKSQNPEIAKLLIRAGANPDAHNRYGRIALFWAVQNQQAELVHLLIQAGANVNAADRFGATPLRFAAAGGSVEVAKRSSRPDPRSTPIPAACPPSTTATHRSTQQ